MLASFVVAIWALLKTIKTGFNIAAMIAEKRGEPVSRSYGLLYNRKEQKVEYDSKLILPF